MWEPRVCPREREAFPELICLLKSESPHFPPTRTRQGALDWREEAWLDGQMHLLRLGACVVLCGHSGVWLPLLASDSLRLQPTLRRWERLPQPGLTHF